jgi:hypothetical protein
MDLSTCSRSNEYAHTVEFLLEMVFSTHSVQRGYKEDSWGYPVSWKSSCEEKTLCVL